MMNSTTVYTQVLTSSAASFAAKNQDPRSVMELASALARDVVLHLANMGLLEDGAAVLGLAPAQTAPLAQPAPAAHFPTAQVAGPPPVAPPPANPTIAAHPAMTATPQAHGVGAPQAPVAVGAGQLAQPAAAQVVNGQLVVPPVGQTFVPPAQAGVMNIVQQVPTPQGHSALGTNGIITPAIQKPMGGEVTVNPSGEKVIQGIGGAQSMLVSEQIAR